MATKVRYHSAASAMANWVGPDTKPPGRIEKSVIGLEATAKSGPSSAHDADAPGKCSVSMALTAAALRVMTARPGWVGSERPGVAWSVTSWSGTYRV